MNKFILLFFFVTHYCVVAAEKSVVFLYAHGLGATQDQVFRLYTKYASDGSANKQWLINAPLALFDFPDALPVIDTYNPSLVNLGQQLDIDRLHEAYQQTLEKFPESEIILFGLSRGATTIINYVSLYKPDRLKALVLESPIDSYENLIKHLMKRFHLSYLPYTVGCSVLKYRFPSIELDGIQPIKSVKWVPRDLPIFLAHSKEDQVIPVTASRNLYQALIHNGNTCAYYCELDHGAHGKIMRNVDAPVYKSALHAFFKRFNIEA
jgi:predicted esterase